MTITEMREKRNKLVGMMDTFLDTHTTDKGTLSAEDDKTYKDMETEVAQLTDSIHRMERREEIEAELSKPTSKPLTGKPMKADGDKAVKTGRASDEYKKALLQAMRTNFRQISNVLQEGIDPQGGYLVPDEYDKRLIDILTEENVMRTLGTNITTSGEHKINIAATKPAAAWIEEGGTLTFGDATFDQIILDAHKLHVAIKVTEELLYDNAFNLENYILTQFGKALSNAEEDAFINGTGVGQPLGILAETGGAQVGVTSASSTKVTADEIINLVYSLKRPYRKNAVFLANDVCVAELRKLKDNNGQYLWQPSLQAGEPDRVLVGDFSYYNIGDRGTRSFAELKELFAGNGMIGFVAKERVDGKLVLPEAIKLLQMKSGS